MSRCWIFSERAPGAPVRIEADDGEGRRDEAQASATIMWSPRSRVSGLKNADVA